MRVGCLLLCDGLCLSAIREDLKQSLFLSTRAGVTAQEFQQWLEVTQSWATHQTGSTDIQMKLF